MPCIPVLGLLDGLLSCPLELVVRDYNLKGMMMCKIHCESLAYCTEQWPDCAGPRSQKKKKV